MTYWLWEDGSNIQWRDPELAEARSWARNNAKITSARCWGSDSDRRRTTGATTTVSWVQRMRFRKWGRHEKELYRDAFRSRRECYNAFDESSRSVEFECRALDAQSCNYAKREVRICHSVAQWDEVWRSERHGCYQWLVTMYDLLKLHSSRRKTWFTPKYWYGAKNHLQKWFWHGDSFEEYPKPSCQILL